jgi:hypothetical protein
VKSSDFACAAAAGDDDEDSGDGGIDEVSDGDGDEQEEYEKWKVRLGLKQIVGSRFISHNRASVAYIVFIGLAIAMRPCTGNNSLAGAAGA